jgi:hypothetical protein
LKTPCGIPKPSLCPNLCGILISKYTVFLKTKQKRYYFET